MEVVSEEAMSEVTRKLKASMQSGALNAMRRLREIAQESRGAIMVEMVVTVLVFSLVGTAVLSGVATTQTSGFKTETQSIQESMARNQMEYMFSLPYQDPPTSYPTISVPQGYEVTCVAAEIVPGDPNIEKVIVTVTFDGTHQLVLETLRAK